MPFWSFPLAGSGGGTGGTTGPSGSTPPARTVLATTGVPANDVGLDGDFAYDNSAGVMYGPKAAGQWHAGRSLVGPPGEPGPPGNPGTPGAPGGAGPKGDTGVGFARYRYHTGIVQAGNRLHFVGQITGASLTTQAVIANREYTMPFLAGAAAAISGLVIKANNAPPANTTVTLAIYDNDATLPLAPVRVGRQLWAGSTTLTSIAETTVPVPNIGLSVDTLYWVTFRSTTAFTSLAVPGSSAWPILGMGMSWGGGFGWLRDGTGGALSDPYVYDANTVMIQGNNLPAVGVQLGAPGGMTMPF